MVFVNVSPSKSLMRFQRKGKLSHRYIGPIELTDRVGTIAYWIAQPSNLSSIHNVFHISMLHKYEPDPLHILDYEPIDLTDLTYVQRLVRILDRMEQVLRTKTIPLIKCYGITIPLRRYLEASIFSSCCHDPLLIILQIKIFASAIVAKEKRNGVYFRVWQIMHKSIAYATSGHIWDK